MGLNVVGAVGLLALVLASGAAAGTARLPLRRRRRRRAARPGRHVYLFNLGRSAVPVGVAPGEVHYTFGLANITEAVRYYVFDLTLKRLIAGPGSSTTSCTTATCSRSCSDSVVAAASAAPGRRRFVPACLALLAVALLLSVIAVRRPSAGTSGS
jgi:hypothetical protein